jgi:hypothetical protein
MPPVRSLRRKSPRGKREYEQEFRSPARPRGNGRRRNAHSELPTTSTLQATAEPNQEQRQNPPPATGNSEEVGTLSQSGESDAEIILPLSTK